MVESLKKEQDLYDAEEASEEEQEQTMQVEKKVKVGKKQTKIDIFIDNQSHAKYLLDKLVEQRVDWNGTLIAKNARLHWYHPGCKDEDILEHLNAGPGKTASRYPDIKDLAHKDIFGKSMRFAIDNDADNYSFVPPTFEFPNPSDEAKFAAYKKKHPGATFIAKPQVGA